MLAALGAAFFLVFRFGMPFIENVSSGAKKVASTSAALIQKTGQRLKENKPKKKNSAPAIAISQPQPPAGPAGNAMPSLLSPQEGEILNQCLPISEDRKLSKEEKKILDAKASFKSGFSEKLPSKAWTLENFEEMISQQENYYRVPLPRSYRKKAIAHFTQYYLPGAEAFKNGDLLAARDAWVASLALPAYSNDVQRHRGVALTMLRPFINDTLSKIGVINSVLVEKEIREREQKVVSAYSEVSRLIDKESWKKALEKMEEAQKTIDVLTGSQKPSSVPPYPPSLNRVDQDIQATLRGILQVPPPAIADWEPMRQDIVSKKNVIESLLPEKIKPRLEVYQEACQLIRDKKWQKAKAKLQEVDLPEALAKDAAAKIQILKKLSPE